MKQSTDPEIVRRQCLELVVVLATCRAPTSNDNQRAIVAAFAEAIASAKRIVGDMSGEARS